MAISVEQSRPQDHRFRVHLKIDGRPYSGWMSLDPTAKDEKRNLILVTVPIDGVPERHRDSFANFVERIRSLDLRATSAAKQAVIKIATGEWTDDHYGIAVHKMGPVPAYILKGQRFRVQALDDTATIAFYPYSLGSWTGRGHALAVALDLFASLVKTDAYRVLATYFEDIFEHFKDMSEKLGIIDCMHRIRAIREVLGRSVGEKLENLTPSPEAWFQYQDYKRRITSTRTPGDEKPPPLSEHELRVCVWFADHYVWIGEAIYLSCVAQACISKFFQLLGLELQLRDAAVTIRKMHYYTERDCIESFCTNYRFDQADFDSSRLVASAHRLLEIYEQGGDELRNADAPERIMRNLRDYLAFVRLARNELRHIYSDKRSARHEPIVFVSRRLQSEFGKIAAQAFAESVDKVWGSASRITTFEGSGGQPLRRSVKAQIWLSDSFWSVLPEQDHPVGDDVSWLYLEAEHAFLLGKPPTTVARNRHDFFESQKRLAAVNDPPLAEQLTCSRDLLRAGTLGRYFEDVAIIADSKEQLVNRISANLQELRDTVMRSRRVALLTGYLRMYLSDDVAAFDLIDRSFRRANKSFAMVTFTRSQFEAKAAGTTVNGKMFINAHRRSKLLSVKISGDPVTVLQWFEGQRVYVFNLDRIARGITGDTSVSDDVLADDVRAAVLQAYTERRTEGQIAE